MNVTVTKRKGVETLTDAELASIIKGLMGDDKAAYSRYVQLCSLRPRLNAKDFFALFRSVEPMQWPSVVEVVDFQQTHWDLLPVKLGVGKAIPVEITPDETGWGILWVDGRTGHDPIMEPFDSERFVPFDEYDPQFLSSNKEP